MYVGPLGNQSQGPVEGAPKRGDRATAFIEGIWCAKIRGCSYRQATRVSDVPIAEAGSASPTNHAAVTRASSHATYERRRRGVGGVGAEGSVAASAS
jgi:hypothetical protein